MVVNLSFDESSNTVMMICDYTNYPLPKTITWNRKKFTETSYSVIWKSQPEGDVIREINQYDDSKLDNVLDTNLDDRHKLLLTGGTQQDMGVYYCTCETLHFGTASSNSKTLGGKIDRLLYVHLYI